MLEQLSLASRRPSTERKLFFHCCFVGKYLADQLSVEQIHPLATCLSKLMARKAVEAGGQKKRVQHLSALVCKCPKLSLTGNCDLRYINFIAVG